MALAVEPVPTLRSQPLVITTICYDDRALAPDGQRNTVGLYANLTMANHAAYARARGYLYKPSVARQEDVHRDIRWHKLSLLRSLLKSHEWVFWTDCDSLFMDFCVGLERWTTYQTADLVFSGDKNYAINTGQLLLRSSAWTQDLLLRAEREPVRSHGCSGNDNAALNWLLWKDCARSGARGNFTLISPADESRCTRMAARSLYPTRLACGLRMNTYPGDYARALRYGPVLRLHFAGAQKGKDISIRRFLGWVSQRKRCPAGP